MGIKATTLLPVVGAGAVVAGVLVGMWAGGGGEPLPGAGDRSGAQGSSGASHRASGDPGSGEEGPWALRGSPLPGGSAPVHPGSAADDPSSFSIPSPDSPSGAARPSSSAAAGAVPRGTSTGRPASTSVTGEPGDDPSSTDAPTPPRSVPGRTGALPPYALPARISGRIADALTGAVPAGAEVSLRWELSDGTVSSSVSVNVAGDGTFEVEPREPMREEMARMIGEGGWLRDRFRTVEDGLADLEYSLVGRAKGYGTLVKGDPAPETDLMLVPEGLDLLPGTVRVDAKRGDGSRFPGRMLVDFLSADRGSFSQWAHPEADGTFLLPGVPAGRWSVRAAGKHDGGTKVEVPESGEVRAEILVPRAGLAEAEGAPAGAPREVGVAVPGRNLPAGTFLRAEARPGLFFRVEVAGGRAAFAALPAGAWTFVLQSPGRTEERFAAEVEAGEGPLEREFPAPGAGGEGGGR